MRKWSLIPRKTIHPHPSHQPPENFEKPRAMQTKNKKRTEPHIVQHNKQQQETF